MTDQKGPPSMPPLRRASSESLPDLFGRLLKKSAKFRKYQMRFVRLHHNALFYSKKQELLQDVAWLRKQENDYTERVRLQGEGAVRLAGDTMAGQDVVMIPMASVRRVFQDPKKPHKFHVQAGMGDREQVYNFRVPDRDVLWIYRPSTEHDGKREAKTKTCTTWVKAILAHLASTQERLRADAVALANDRARRRSSSARGSVSVSRGPRHAQSTARGSRTNGSGHTKQRSVMDLQPITESENKLVQIADDDTAGDESSEDSRRLQSMVSYVPRIMLDQYLRKDMSDLAMGRPNNTSKFSKPMSFHLPNSCIMLADVSGFTNLNEAFSTVEGGAEKVTYHLNQYFTILLNIIEKHGGDCIKFAGDALIVLFKEEEEYEDQVYISRVHHHVKPIAKNQYTCLRAIRCALELGAQPPYRITGVSSFEKVELTLHVAIGYGDICAIHVGGFNGAWEFLLTGSPFKQLSKAIDLSKQGEVVVTKEVWAEVSKHCKGRRVSHSYGCSEIKISSIIHDVKVVSARPLVLPLQLKPIIERYIPKTVTDGLERNIKRWLAELRTASVIFVNIKGLQLNKPRGTPLAVTHDVLGCMQSVVACNQGYLRQFLVDDKGTVLIVVFGVPPFSWEDNGYRSVKTAMELRDSLVHMGITHAVGVASGMVYVGSVGSISRREHSVVGDTVNTAARLSCKAPANSIWIDENTQAEAQRKINMQACGTIKVKGKDKTLRIYQPMGFKIDNCLLRGGAVFGRVAVVKTFMTALADLKEAGIAASAATTATDAKAPPRGAPKSVKRLLWLTGAAGLGKTAILGKFYMLSKDNCDTYYTLGEATAKSLPHHIWGELLSRILGLTKTSPALNRFRILRIITASKSLGHLERYLPLLNLLLPCDYPPTDISTRLMAGHDEESLSLVSHFTGKILLGLVLESVKKPSVWVVDDAHNIDMESLRLLFAIYQQLPNVLMVVASRPDSGAAAVDQTPVNETDFHQVSRTFEAKSRSEAMKIKVMKGKRVHANERGCRGRAGKPGRSTGSDTLAMLDPSKLTLAGPASQSQPVSPMRTTDRATTERAAAPPALKLSPNALSTDVKASRKPSLHLNIQKRGSTELWSGSGSTDDSKKRMDGDGMADGDRMADAKGNSKFLAESMASDVSTPVVTLQNAAWSPARSAMNSGRMSSVVMSGIPQLRVMSSLTPKQTRARSHSPLPRASSGGIKRGSQPSKLRHWMSTQATVRKNMLDINEADAALATKVSRRSKSEGPSPLARAASRGRNSILSLFRSGSDTKRRLMGYSPHVRSGRARRDASPLPHVAHGLDESLQELGAERVELTGLDRQSLDYMLRRQLRVDRLPAELLNFVVERAHGNPFVAGEIVLALRSKGIVSVSGSRLEFDEKEDLQKLALPTSVKSLIIMRLDQLPTDELLACKLASIFGITFPKDGLAYVWSREGYTVERLWSALNALEQKQHMLQQTSAKMYMFTQPLVAEACVDTILYERRARIHLLISEFYTTSLMEPVMPTPPSRNEPGVFQVMPKLTPMLPDLGPAAPRSARLAPSVHGSELDADDAKTVSMADSESANSTFGPRADSKAAAASAFALATPSSRRLSRASSAGGSDPTLNQSARLSESAADAVAGGSLSKISHSRLGVATATSLKPDAVETHGSFLSTGNSIKNITSPWGTKRPGSGASPLAKRPAWARSSSIDGTQERLSRKIGENYVSACLFSTRCPQSAALAALQHLNSKWTLAQGRRRREGQSRASAAPAIVQKAFKIQSVYDVEEAKEMELFRKYKKLFDFFMKESLSSEKNVRAMERDLEINNKAWKKAVAAGDRKLAQQIRDKSLHIFSKFRKHGVKSDCVHLDMFKNVRKVMKQM